MSGGDLMAGVRAGTQAIITEIQRYSVHDGPGIRTLVFFKGCRLACAWCHNPETIVMRPQLLIANENCIACDLCIKACPEQIISYHDGGVAVDRTACTLCGECVEVCYPGALTMTGRFMTVEQIMREVIKDLPFYQSSGGGMTLSGGEVLMYRKFATDLLTEAKAKGIHTAVETAGMGGFADLEALIPVTDLFLFDLKAMNTDVHRLRTGKGNERILSNLRKLVSRGANVTVRVPVIPDVNDNWENMNELSEFIRDLGLSEVHFLPFHQFGASKWEAVGMDYAFRDVEPMPVERVEMFAEQLRKDGLEVSVGGQ